MARAENSKFLWRQECITAKTAKLETNRESQSKPEPAAPGVKTPRARFWNYKRICTKTKHSLYWEAQVWFTQEIRVSAGRAPMNIQHWDLAQAPRRISAKETVSSGLLPQLPHGHPAPRPENPAQGHWTVGAAQEAAGRSHRCESSTSRNPARAASVGGVKQINK